ncbi:phosphatidylglycerol lysyltransferase domain-containing protein [Tepidiforma sp.]|uniref:bifunctional lysylphosphatidylglycerol flippase/synthetase MprF n=1 Tax=Tepidiforma sp. TaxID=2682230 RepID=UPI002ADE8D6E|nr:phosphatidylglycerol lysyltransferase domain-containing protein [Tepidiforma sp.]
MTRAGLPGRRRRRIAAAAVAFDALLGFGLAIVHHPPIVIGPLHRAFPVEAVVTSRFLLVLASLAQVGSVNGLLRGKRQAWTIATLGALVAVACFQVKRADLVGIAGSGATAVLLLLWAPLFPARSDPATVRRGLAWFAFGTLGAFAYGMVGLFVLDRHFRGSESLRAIAEDTLRLVLIIPEANAEPVGRHGRWFLDSVRLVMVASLTVGTWQVLAPVRYRLAEEQRELERVRAILERWGTTSLAYFHLMPDKSHFFARSGEAFIGYRVVRGVAVALGGPVGEPGASREVAREFIEFCELNGWMACFHQCTPTEGALLQELGLRTLKIGEEAVVRLEGFQLAGKSFKHIRNVTNRLEREGYTVEELPQPLADAVLAELRAVSDAWLAHGRHRERQFTLGWFDEQYLRQTRVLVLRSPEGRIEAFANLLPPFASRIGNFDLMRRRPDAPDGAMDYLFVRMAELFRGEGMEGMSLGFAPLANVDEGGVKGQVLRWLYAYGERFFNFKGLRAFKAKWGPEWEPRYLVYGSDGDLPAVALAVALVGERRPLLGWRREPRVEGLGVGAEGG